MADDIYSVRVSRQEGLVEITGSDKDWIAEQLDKLTAVFAGTTVAPAEARRRLTARAAKTEEAGSRDTGEPAQRSRRSGTRRASRVPELEQRLTSPVKVKLQKWRDEREDNFKKALSQAAAIIATFLLDELKWESIGPDDIYTVYVIMGWAPPGDPKAQLENARARSAYFGPWSGGKVQLSHTGERFGRIESKVPPAKKVK